MYKVKLVENETIDILQEWEFEKEEKALGLFWFLDKWLDKKKVSIVFEGKPEHSTKPRRIIKPKKGN